MLVWAYQQKVSRLKNVAEKLKIRYGKNKTISVRVKGRLDPIFTFMTLVQIGLGGYVIGRSAEKAAPAVAKAIGKK